MAQAKALSFSFISLAFLASLRENNLLIPEQVLCLCTEDGWEVSLALIAVLYLVDYNNFQRQTTAQRRLPRHVDTACTTQPIRNPPALAPVESLYHLLTWDRLSGCFVFGSWIG
jgi:hypothetical protein